MSDLDRLGFQFLVALSREGKLHNYLRIGQMLHLFLGPERPVAERFVSHIREHGAIPSRTTLGEWAEDPLPEAPEPSSFYSAELIKRFLERSLRSGVDEAGRWLKPLDKNPERAVDTMLHYLSEARFQTWEQRLWDARDCMDHVYLDYVERNRRADPGIELGWPTFDEMTGGLGGDDLVSYVGRPQRGKTWLLIYSALHSWRVGKKVLFVSMEMSPRLILRRLASIVTEVPAQGLKIGMLSNLERERLKSRLGPLRGMETPFWVLDGTQAQTVEDLALVARQTRPDVVIVDGAYLIGHFDKRLGKFQRVGAVCEGLKNQVVMPLGVPVLASWQFNRAAAKKKSSETVSIEDIAYADEIGQISSIILGLFDEEGPSSVNRKRIRIIKGRGGEQGEFMCKWDFLHMDFGEYREPPQDQELEHIDHPS